MAVVFLRSFSGSNLVQKESVEQTSRFDIGAGMVRNRCLSRSLYIYIYIYTQSIIYPPPPKWHTMFLLAVWTLLGFVV